MTLQEIYDNSSALKLTVRDYLLLQIYAATPAGGGGGTGAIAVLTSYVEESTGIVNSGSLAVTFTTSDDFEGDINGVARDAGASYVFNPTAGYTNPEINYTIVSGSIKIDRYTKE